MSLWARALALAAVTFAAFAAGCSQPPPPPVYQMQPLVPPGSPFHGIHGLRFDEDDKLYATSVIGQSIFRIDTETGAIERVVPPPRGMADDLAFAADGTMVWTAIEDGIVYAMAPSGAIRRLVENRRGVNAVSFSPDRKRLFFSLVFYGDALYELDLSGAIPPRLIVENIGGLNAFEVGDDGMIYGPLLFMSRIVRINPDSGEITTISEDFENPNALKLDYNGSAFVLDDDVIKRVDLSSGATTGTMQLPYDADNLAIDSAGRVFVSLSAPNAIAEVNIDTGALRYALRPSKLNSPTGVAVHTDGGVDTVYLGDLFGGIRRVNGASGEVEPTPAVDLFQPAHIFVNDEHLIAVSQVFGTIQRFDRSTFALLNTWEGFNLPGDAIEASNGDVIVAETATGRLLKVTGPAAEDREVLATDLAAPTGLAWAPNGAIYVAETGAGRLLRIDAQTRETTELASGLAQPEGIAVMADGGIVVIEVGAKRLTRVEPDGASSAFIAADIPVGLSNGPSLYRGVAASESAIYFSSDVDNAVYKLTPHQP